MKRRGCKENPFKLGEEVYIHPKGTTGKVVQVIHAPPRGQMRYRVEYTPVGVRTEEFNCSRLEEVGECPSTSSS